MDGATPPQSDINQGGIKMLSCRQSFIVTQVCWQGICDLTLLAEVKTPAELCIVGKKNAASLKPNQTQLLAAGNSPSSPTPLGADPVKNTHPLLSLLPFGCCVCSGRGSSTLGFHSCHPAWHIMARSGAQALSLCAASWGTLGQWSLPWCQLPALCRLLGWQDAPQRFFLLVRGF